jgi:hypothetical protein
LDGKFDNRKANAILLPHIVDLEKFHRCFTKYLAAPFRLSADGLGDAALSSLIDLRLMMIWIHGHHRLHCFDPGHCPWSKQQQSRTALHSYEVSPAITFSCSTLYTVSSEQGGGY